MGIDGAAAPPREGRREGAVMGPDIVIRVK